MAFYGERKEFQLVGHIDSDWERLVDDWKSTTAYVLSLGIGANLG